MSALAIPSIDELAAIVRRLQPDDQKRVEALLVALDKAGRAKARVTVGDIEREAAALGVTMPGWLLAEVEERA